MPKKTQFAFSLLIFALSHLSHQVALAEDSSFEILQVFQSFWSKGREVLSRTEYSNQGLLNGINYNPWLYPGSMGKGPTGKLEQIRERANQSEQDAQDLLVGLSAILKDQEPAGIYVVDLYKDLLVQSQKEVGLEQQVIVKLLSDRSFWQQQKDEKNDLISQALCGFLKTDLKVRKDFAVSLFSDDDLHRLFSCFKKDLNQPSKVLSEIINQILSSNDSRQSLRIENTLTDVPFQKEFIHFESRKLVEGLEQITNIRLQILETIPSLEALEIAKTRLQDLRRVSDSRQRLFQYLIYQPEIEILQRLADDETIRLLSAQIRLLAETAEELNVEVKTRFALLSSRAGHVGSRAFHGMRRGFLDGKLRSEDYKKYLEAVDFRNLAEDELVTLAQSLISTCEHALLNSDELILKSCGSDLLVELIDAYERPRLRDVVKNELKKVINILVFRIAGDYIDERQLTLKCHWWERPEIVERDMNNFLDMQTSKTEPIYLMKEIQVVNAFRFYEGSHWSRISGRYFGRQELHWLEADDVLTKMADEEPDALVSEIVLVDCSDFARGEVKPYGILVRGLNDDWNQTFVRARLRPSHLEVCIKENFFEREQNRNSNHFFGQVIAISEFLLSSDILQTANERSIVSILEEATELAFRWVLSSQWSRRALVKESASIINGSQIGPLTFSFATHLESNKPFLYELCQVSPERSCQNNQSELVRCQSEKNYEIEVIRKTN